MPPRKLAPSTLRRRALYGWPQHGPGADPEDHPEVDAWSDAARLRVGTSGWSYPHWRGRFYPSSLPQTRLLPFASRRLPTLEVNMTYRRLPGPHVFDAWRDAVPPGFLFSVKAPRSITHDARLEGIQEETTSFLRHAWRLRESLGLVLFQLPPSMKADLPLLSGFLERLPPGPRYAFEMRHPSWFARDVYLLLAQYAASFVVHDFGRRGAPLVETAPFVYLRLHGPSGRYRGSYDVPTLFAWAMKVQEWMQRGFEVFVYFNNDERGHAIRDAQKLRDLAGTHEEKAHVGGREAR